MSIQAIVRSGICCNVVGQELHYYGGRSSLGLMTFTWSVLSDHSSEGGDVILIQIKESRQSETEVM